MKPKWGTTVNPDYRKQIDALLAGDRETLEEMYGIFSCEEGESLAFSIWSATGFNDDTKSIFNSIPGCGVCLTMLKGSQNSRTANEIYVGLRLEDEELIPFGSPDQSWNPYAEVLERFAKLREMADTFTDDSA